MLFTLCVNICVYVCVPLVCQVPLEARKVVEARGIGTIDHCELPCGCRELNSGLLEEQPVLTFLILLHSCKISCLCIGLLFVFVTSLYVKHLFLGFSLTRIQ